MNFQPKKLLLIFQLSNTLLYLNNPKPKMFIPPTTKSITYHDSILDDRYNVCFRKGREDFLNYFFKEEQKNIDVAIWTCFNHEFAQTLVKKYFSRYFRHLLFVMATDRSLYGAHKELETNIRIKKELSRVYSNFPGYNEGNTLIVSSSENLLESYKRNDVIIPEFCPQSGMFEVDPGMHPFIKYSRGLMETQKTHNLADIRTMVAAKNMTAMFKRTSHNIYTQIDYN